MKQIPTIKFGHKIPYFNLVLGKSNHLKSNCFAWIKIGVNDRSHSTTQYIIDSKA